MKHEQLSYPEALRWLAKKYHIEIKERELTDEEKAEQSERESMFVVNEWANEWFQQQMNDTVDGRAVGLAYFRHRGFRDDIIKKFQLGFCPDKYDAQWQAGQAAGYNPDFLLKTGLCIRNEAGKTYDRFRNRVIFPIHTISGKVVGFGGRVLASATKGVSIKYQNSPESVIYSKKRELYGLFFAKKAIVKEDLCYLVEGYTDVMAMHQMGVENVVASSGTALTHEQIRAIHRFTENITVIYDGDAAGIKASQRGIDMILAEGLNVKLLLLPDGDDPDSFARKHTQEEYQTYLREHQVDFIRFKTDLLMDEAKGDPIKLSRLTNNIVQSLAAVPDAITRTYYIKETSQMLQVEERLITSAVAKALKNAEPRNSETQTQDDVTTPTTTDVQTPKEDTTGQILPPQDTAFTTPPNITPPQRQNGDPLLRIERLLIQMIIRHGEKIMATMNEGSEGEEDSSQAITVLDFIQYSLESDSISLRLPLHRRIYEEALEHLHEEGFRCDRYFSNHPDLEIANLANDLAHDPEVLSKIHTKMQTIPTEEERLVDLLPHLMTDYKLAVVEEMLKGLLTELRDPQVLADKERRMEIMRRYQEVKASQAQLAHLRGDRVIMR